MSRGALAEPDMRAGGVLRRYGQYLPLTAATPLITLGEGGTPLVRSSRLERELGIGALYFKLELCNPTGSFKDRGMVVAVAKAVEDGAQAVLCASTGNTSASSSAYAAHCGLDSYVIVPAGKIAAGKMAQAVAYGAKIIAVQGNFDAALNAARELAERTPLALVNSVNPHRIAGQKTASFEICDDLGDAPDLLCIPVGNAGNITAYWKGFTEYAEYGKVTRHPRMMGFQAAGAAPLVTGRPVEQPETIASAIRIGNPASWKGAIDARDESQGEIAAVSDDQILEAYALLARKEGLFVEPASAASVAGVIALSRAGRDLSELVVACVLTGSGLKDPQTATEHYQPEVIETAPDAASIERALGWT